MQSIGFEIINNKKIFFILSEQDAKKIVIMSHGFRGSSIGPEKSFVEFESLLNSKGYSTLRFDQFGSGNSEGNFIDSSFNQWIETIAYFTQKYLKAGYQVILLGQSMGATATMAVAAKDLFKNSIPCILLWVPDPKQDIDVDPNTVYEEAGQKYKGSFWLEAKKADFYDCLEKYQGGIHLVYGENDRYVSAEVRQNILNKVRAKKQPAMVLQGQDHSPWEHDLAKTVYESELKFIQKYTK